MIQHEERGTISLLRLDHGKVSALDTELLSELAERLDEVAGSGARAVVLTGTGSSFSAGVDLWRVLEGGDSYLREFLPALTDGLSRLFSFPRPVIAAVNGHAIAGGCVLACSCDYRIMSDGSGRIGMPELRAGVPFPNLPLEILRFATSDARLQRLVYLGETYGPHEARDLGLIDEVAAPDVLLERAFQLADRLAAIPAQSFQITKRQLRQPVLDRAAQRDKEIGAAVARAWADPEIHVAIQAYMDAVVRKKN